MKDSRVYYRKNPDAVVVRHDGRDVATYPSTDALVETHIKGLLASNEEEASETMALLRKYRTPSDLPRS